MQRLAPDVLVLAEVSAAHWEALRGAGIGELLPHATGSVGGSASTVVATREPATCVDVPSHVRCGEVVDVGEQGTPAVVEGEQVITGFDMPAVRLASGTVVRGVHLWSPRLTPVERWHTDQRAMIEWVAARPEERLVLAGDFNASLSHPVFRQLSAGMSSAPAGMLPWTRTWPFGWPIPPFVQIDHVLARGMTPVAAGTIVIPGSDHAAVWAQLQPR